MATFNPFPRGGWGRAGDSQRAPSAPASDLGASPFGRRPQPPLSCDLRLNHAWFSSPAQLQMTTFNPFPPAAGVAEPRSRGGVVRSRPGSRVGPLLLRSRLYRVPLPSVSVVLLPG